MADRANLNKDSGRYTKEQGIHDTNRKTEHPASINKLALELVHLIVELLGTDDIRNLRLTNRFFCAVGDKHLVSECFIDFRTPVLDKLESISKNDNISSGVHTIVVAVLDLCSIASFEEYSAAATDVVWPTPSDFECREAYDRYKIIYNDQHSLKDGEYEKRVLGAIQRIPHINRIVFGKTSKTHPDAHYWATALVQAGYLWEGHMFTSITCNTIAKAIQLRGPRPIHLTMDDPWMLQASHLHEIWSSFCGLEHIYRLDLRIGDELGTFKISAYKFSALKELRVSGTIRHIDEFLQFLVVHKSTLEHITMNSDIEDISIRDFVGGFRTAIGCSLKSIQLESIPTIWIGLCPSRTEAQNYILNGGLNPCIQEQATDD